MMTKNLFKDRDDVWYTGTDVVERLREVGAADCSMLFVHTDIMFGTLSRDSKRKEYLETLYRCLLALGVKTLLLPTFTFSFANGEDYDVLNSKTAMGALLEYARKQAEVCCHTLDPLLRVSVIGEDAQRFMHLGTQSLGPDSAFERIHEAGGAKFLMFGGEFGESLTYIHHVEKMLEVPYRYDQYFTGNIIDAEGNTFERTQSIHTACGGVLPRCFFELEEELVEQGAMRRARLGDGKLTCVGEKEVYAAIADKLHKDINYFLERPFTPGDLTHEYKYGKNGERVTHC